MLPVGLRTRWHSSRRTLISAMYAASFSVAQALTASITSRIASSVRSRPLGASPASRSTRTRSPASFSAFIQPSSTSRQNQSSLTRVSCLSSLR